MNQPKSEALAINAAKGIFGALYNAYTRVCEVERQEIAMQMLITLHLTNRTFVL